MMRRSQIRLVVATLAILALPAAMVSAAVYDTPHYVTANQAQPQGSMGYCGPCGQPLAPYEVCCKESPADRLTRGVTNFFTGWVEIPKHTICGAMNQNVRPLDGFFVGLARGTGRAVERTGVGFYEAATFFMPGCGPLLCPEYVSWEDCGGGWRYGNYCASPMYAPCPPCGGGNCGWNSWGCGSCGCAQGNGCGQPMWGGMQRPVQPQQQQQQQQQMGMGGYGAPEASSGSARSAGGAGGAAATYPDDYLK